jgi:short subunit fatty acids transporter
MDLLNAATKGVEKALKPQNIIFAVVLTIIVIMIAQFLIKQEIIETNEMVKLTGLLAILNI